MNRNWHLWVDVHGGCASLPALNDGQSHTSSCNAGRCGSRGSL